MANLPAKPAWLDDEVEICATLAMFLDRLDHKPQAQRSQPVTLKLTAAAQPQLFRHDEASDRQWMLLQQLAESVIEIRRNARLGPYDPPFAGASLRLRPGGEAALRHWLNRPAVIPYAELWRQAVTSRQACFADAGKSLAERPIKLGDFDAGELVEMFAAIKRLEADNLTLRQLSARCFRGHSKFLDSREELLLTLFPALRLRARPVIIQVFLPPDPRGVLFIENQDTYIRALHGVPAAVDSLALVYAAGFRGSAQRIRNEDGSILHFSATCIQHCQSFFQDWWYQSGNNGSLDWPLWFWGDLDYAGMGILKALRQRFPGLQAWQPGYAPLLDLLRAGAGHAPEVSGRREQSDPQETGCSYADNVLLPLIRAEQRFLDQEAL